MFYGFCFASRCESVELAFGLEYQLDTDIIFMIETIYIYIYTYLNEKLQERTIVIMIDTRVRKIVRFLLIIFISHSEYISCLINPLT